MSVSADGLSFSGYSGYLNVPDARVTPHGHFDLVYADQVFLPKQGYDHNRNLLASYGVLPNLEVGGRLSWYETHSNCYSREGCGGIRDLSANAKLVAPFIPQEWFSLALGLQDVGGAASRFESYYVTLGRTWGPLTASLGAGRSDVRDHPLDGVFAGVSLSPRPWGSLLVEQDARNFNAGLRLNTPPQWLPLGATLGAKWMAYSEGDVSNDHQYLSVGVQMPFGNRARHAARLREVEPVMDAPLAPSGVPDVKALQATGQALVDVGYERVKVGVKGESVEVRFENNLYNRDERESLMEVSRIVRTQLKDWTGPSGLVMTNLGIPVLGKSLGAQGEMLKGSGGLIDASESEAVTWAFEGGHGPIWKPRIMLAPRISSAIATEYGVQDHALALNANVGVQGWTGFHASIGYNMPVAESEDFREGRVFYGARQLQGVNEVDLQQTFRLSDVLTTFHVGQYAYDYRGGLNQTYWAVPGGRYYLGVRAGRFEHRDNPQDQRDLRLAVARWYLPEQDVMLVARAGEFWQGDKGYRLDARFGFGDYAVGLYYTHTDAQFVGIGWVMPLTPVRDYNHRYLQVRGQVDWTYSIQSRINEDRNTLAAGQADILGVTHTQERLYLNQGRLWFD